jgi:hypothetical protein
MFSKELISKILLTVITSREGNRMLGDKRGKEITIYFCEKGLL